ncbi:ATP-binding protein [uncultured Desulfobulbus sp.]|uniref:sensor histidine kinase n=1 Tax=uncultured Desulfobulbus sp. TaxID=239745 RepID=UPI0029C6B5CF|nr:ATP-binding protein [uncultured Desulfobulbus sp.]
MREKLKNYLRLKRLLSTGFFISGIIPILIIASGSIYNFKQLSINDIEVTARQVVENRNDVINTFLQGQVNFLSTLMHLYQLDFLKDQDNFNKLFLAVNREGSKGEIVDLQLIDTNGKQLAYVGPYQDKVEGKNYKESPWFSEVLVRGAYVSDVFSGFRNYPHFVIALTDPMKTFVLRATINSGIFNSLLYSAQIGANGDAFILNSNGEFQTPSLQKAPKLSEMEIRMLKHHSGTELFTDDEYLYASKWLNGNMWLLVVKTRITDSLEGYYKYRNRIIFMVIITAALFLLISAGISRFIVDRIQRADREQTTLDQQMAHIEKMANIGRLAAGIAHEINNPLQLIQMQAGWIDELLQEENPKNIENLEEYRKSVGKIKQHVHRAGTITHRLLGFSRKISAEYDVQLNELIRETISFLESEANSNNIVLNLHFEESLPMIKTDGAQVQQILMNLIENSLDAVGSEGQVDITTSRSAKEVYVQIADSGPGITPELLERIWEPFFTTKEAGKGTGLGLSICSDIAHKLGGTITVENRPQSGALFTLKLPLRS